MWLMKTEISTFCNEYETVLNPFSTVLRETMDCVERESRKDVLKFTLAGLNDVSHRLKTLVDKIEGQQAYLLIFGPLKSGKSTLMNAISGAYVSEVTSLPAYPCLVYVSHGEEKNLMITRYNGKTKTYPDYPSLQEAISHAHSSLADRIRQKEHEGGDFDPGVDFPEAIRRVDIQLPIQNLMESSTVMVDTPGLYSRMKFGYDLMTREFRNSAACAVFVVKTDNLYLEQVFAEFKDLLDLFSRIFLVVNIDTGKRDLRPDGTLTPSLESQNPEKIIEAFESLAMNAQLKDALEDGRLRIYPIDLLSAAVDFITQADRPYAQAAPRIEAESKSRSIEDQEPPVSNAESSSGIISSPQAAATSVDNDEENENENEAGAEIETEADTEADVNLEEDVDRLSEAGGEATQPTRPPFESFLQDLTDYLNSNEYFIEFMHDSLRQGKTLCQEVASHSSPESLTAFRQSQEDLVHQMSVAEAQSRAVIELKNFNKQGAFDRIRKENDQKANELAESLHDEVSHAMGESLNRWYESDDSFRDLLEDYWDPILKDFANKVGQETVVRVKKLTDNPYGGADFSGEAMRAINTLEFSLADISQEILKDIGSQKSHIDYGLEIQEENIPMRKTLLDWILLRNQASIRRRILGAPHDLSLPVPRDIKRKRLGQEGLQAIHQLSIEALNKQFQEIPRTGSEQTMGRYVTEFLNRLNAKIDSAQSELNDLIKKLQKQIESDKVITNAIDHMREQIQGIEESIEELATRSKKKFSQAALEGEMNPEEETSPAEFSPQPDSDPSSEARGEEGHGEFPEPDPDATADLEAPGDQPARHDPTAY